MKNILVIDDAATVRMYVRQILENEGFHVEEAANGLEGLEKALVQVFDLVLCDINMPVMDGYTTVGRFRQERTLAHIPIVMISTESKTQDANRAFAAGANDYMIKPINPKQLILEVRMLTGGADP